MKVFLTLIFALCGVVPVLRTSAICANSDEVPDVSNANVCNCNPASYTSKETPPIPAIDCSGGKLKVSLKKCELEISLFSSSDLHLNDNTCVGTVVNENNINNIVLSSTLSTAACGNILTVNTSHITYSNTLVIRAKRNNIVTRNDFNVNVSCSYPVNATVKLNTTLNPVIGVSTITAPGGNAEYIVLMKAFTDVGFSEELTVDTHLEVEDTIYISVNVPELEASSFAVSVNRIYATGVSGVEYNLLSDGCPAGGDGQDLLTVRQNGNSTESRFAMNVFKIDGSPTVNLFADLSICNGTCVKNCSASLPKSFKSAGETTTVGVTITAEDRIDISSGATDRFSLPFTLGSLLLSILFAKLM